MYCYNLCGIKRTYVRSARPIEEGRRTVGVRFHYEGGGLGRGGSLSLEVDGHPVGAGRVDRSTQFLFSQEGTFDIGVDRGAPVTDEYEGNRRNAYTGRLRSVTIMVGEDALRPDPEVAIASALEGH